MTTEQLICQCYTESLCSTYLNRCEEYDTSDSFRFKAQHSVDKANHWKLFHIVKLIVNNLPTFIIRLHIDWYQGIPLRAYSEQSGKASGAIQCVYG